MHQRSHSGHEKRTAGFIWTGDNLQLGEVRSSKSGKLNQLNHFQHIVSCSSDRLLDRSSGVQWLELNKSTRYCTNLLTYQYFTRLNRLVCETALMTAQCSQITTSARLLNCSVRPPRSLDLIWRACSVSAIEEGKCMRQRQQLIGNRTKCHDVAHTACMMMRWSAEVTRKRGTDVGVAHCSWASVYAGWNTTSYSLRQIYSR